MDRWAQNGAQFVRMGFGYRNFMLVIAYLLYLLVNTYWMIGDDGLTPDDLKSVGILAASVGPFIAMFMGLRAVKANIEKRGGSPEAD